MATEKATDEAEATMCLPYSLRSAVLRSLLQVKHVAFLEKLPSPVDDFAVVHEALVSSQSVLGRHPHNLT